MLGSLICLTFAQQLLLSKRAGPHDSIGMHFFVKPQTHVLLYCIQYQCLLREFCRVQINMVKHIRWSIKKCLLSCASLVHTQASNEAFGHNNVRHKAQNVYKKECAKCTCQLPQTGARRTCWQWCSRTNTDRRRCQPMPEPRIQRASSLMRPAITRRSKPSKGSLGGCMSQQGPAAEVVFLHMVFLPGVTISGMEYLMLDQKKAKSVFQYQLFFSS